MKIPQKLYVMINEGVIAFFYMNDIVICYRKKDEDKAKSTIHGLQLKYELSKLKDLK